MIVIRQFSFLLFEGVNLNKDTYLECLFKTVVVVDFEKVVDSLRLVATQQLNVSLHHVRGRGYLLLCLRPINSIHNT